MALKEEQNPQDLLSIINKKDEALATRNEALLREEEISKGYRKRELLPEQKELTAEQIKDEKFRQYRPNYVNIDLSKRGIGSQTREYIKKFIMIIMLTSNGSIEIF